MECRLARTAVDEREATCAVVVQSLSDDFTGYHCSGVNPKVQQSNGAASDLALVHEVELKIFERVQGVMVRAEK